MRLFRRNVKPSKRDFQIINRYVRRIKKNKRPEQLEKAIEKFVEGWKDMVREWKNEECNTKIKRHVGEVLKEYKKKDKLGIKEPRPPIVIPPNKIK